MFGNVLRVSAVTAQNENSEYKYSITLKFDAGAKFDLKASLDMTPVKEKFDAAVDIITKTADGKFYHSRCFLVFSNGKWLVNKVEYKGIIQ